MKKKIKIVLIVVLAVIVIVFLGSALFLLSYLGYFSKGNSKTYALEKVETVKDSPLAGMNIAFLGSSVTDGARSKNVSFVEYLAKRNDFTYVKEAVSGTTLVDNGEDSYVSRLQSGLDSNASYDMLVVQLSTNDAGDDPKPLGTVSDSNNLEDFDTSTVTGAIEYIVCYAKETWDCPVVFYTGTKNSKNGYENMIDALYQAQEKWEFKIIDLWKELDTDIPEFSLYMADDVHPTQAGYLEWWTPVMEKHLYEYVE